MKRNLKKNTWGVTVGLMTGALLVASPAFAVEELELGEPTHGGSGCPAGSVGTALNDSGTELSVFFDDFMVEAGGVTGKRVGRKNCSVGIPVHVPQGFSIALVDVDYRGYTYLPRGTRAMFSAEYFFAGSRGPRLRKSFRGELDDEYLITDNLIARALVWSKCGADTILRINTSMTAISNRWLDDVLATVDSADISTGVVYQIQWRRCRGGRF